MMDLYMVDSISLIDWINSNDFNYTYFQAQLKSIGTTVVTGYNKHKK